MLIESNLNNIQIKERFNFDFFLVKRAINEFFSDKIKLPVFIHFDGRLGNRSSTVVARNTLRSFSRATENKKLLLERNMSLKFLEESENYYTHHNLSFYSHIKISSLKIAKEINSVNYMKYWNAKEFYTEESFEKNINLCCFLHIIAHELGHTIQDLPFIQDGVVKFLSYRVKFNKIISENNTEMSYNLESFSKYHLRRFSEIDAECFAREFGPVMVEYYLENNDVH